MQFIVTRPIKRRELAFLLNISEKTIQRHIKAHGHCYGWHELRYSPRTIRYALAN